MNFFSEENRNKQRA